MFTSEFFENNWIFYEHIRHIFQELIMREKKIICDRLWEKGHIGAGYNC